MGQVYFSTSKIDAKHNLLTKISGRQNLLNAIHMQTELFYGKTAKVQANWKMQTCSSFFNKNSESKMKYCGKPLLWLASYDVCILSSADICILASDDESWWRLHMHLQVAIFTCTRFKNRIVRTCNLQGPTLAYLQGPTLAYLQVQVTTFAYLQVTTFAYFKVTTIWCKYDTSQIVSYHMVMIV